MSFVMMLVAGSASGAATGLKVQGQLTEGVDTYKAAMRKANRVIIDSRFKINDIERNRINTIASQRATYASSGVKLSGSPLETMAETNYLAGVDKARIRYESNVQASELRLAGKSAMSKARMEAIGSLVGGVGSMVGSVSGAKGLA